MNVSMKIKDIIKLYNEKNFYEALNSINSFLESNTQNNQAYNLKGVILRALGRSNEALLSYDIGISINPNDHLLYNNKANVLRDLKKFNEAEECYKLSLKIDNNYYKTLCNLSELYIEVDDYEKSEYYSKKSILINDMYPEAYRVLGVAQKKLNKKNKSIKNFKKYLEFNPHSSTVIHQIDLLEGNTPETSPVEFIKDVFDSYAYRFEEHLMNDLNYAGPKAIKDLIKNNFYKNKAFTNILDLGCGTGLNGFFLKTLCKNLIGIDLSENMLRIAEEKSIYDRLIKDDFINVLEKEEISYDLFVASDVFIYTGKLEKIFELINLRSSKESWFIFTTENQKNGTYNLQDTGRYTHSINYIKNLCEKNNFKINFYQDFDLRIQNKQWVKGNIFLVKILN